MWTLNSGRILNNSVPDTLKCHKKWIFKFFQRSNVTCAAFAWVATHHIHGSIHKHTGLTLLEVQPLTTPVARSYGGGDKRATIYLCILLSEKLPWVKDRFFLICFICISVLMSTYTFCAWLTPTSRNQSILYTVHMQGPRNSVEAAAAVAWSIIVTKHKQQS